MIKYLAVLAAIMSLTGCFYQTVSENDIREAERLCGGREFVEAITSSAMGQEIAICRNGTNIRLWMSHG